MGELNSGDKSVSPEQLWEEAGMRSDDDEEDVEEMKEVPRPHQPTKEEYWSIICHTGAGVLTV